MVREKKTDMFAGVRVPEWLYRKVIQYSKKYDVSHSHICRDALKFWLQASREPSKEERFIDDMPGRRKKTGRKKPD